MSNVMKIIIDGYNLLKSLPHVQGITVQGLVKKLIKYAQQKNHIIILVFDGGASSWPFKIYEGTITITYSGTKISADAVIKGLMEEECKGKECLIVSSDREIRVYAQKNNIVSIDSPNFYTFLRAPLSSVSSSKKNQPPLKRPGYESSAELDSLMESSKSFVKGEESYESKEKMLSKKDKRIDEILKKL
jgi:predicted RNA-binding protein with PIN domain